MGEWLRIAVWSFVSVLRSRRDLVLENVALRQQLMVLDRQPGHVRLKDRDRLFWVWLHRLWTGWRQALGLVQPATVVEWHRKGFRSYWRWKSRARGGRSRIDPSVRQGKDLVMTEIPSQAPALVETCVRDTGTSGTASSQREGPCPERASLGYNS